MTREEKGCKCHIKSARNRCRLIGGITGLSATYAVGMLTIPKDELREAGYCQTHDVEGFNPPLKQ